MPNVTYDSAGDLVATPIDGSATITYNLGDIAWILSSTALVMIMTPGLGFFYSGLLRRKNALSMVFMAFAIYCLVTFQWFFWGYSLAFAHDGSVFMGTLANFGLINVLDAPSAGSSRIPDLAYCIYQSMFAAITPAIAFGAAAERGRMGPVLLLAFCWATVVYDPIACWTWAPNGWLFQLGGLDFAGGGPVHLSSGTAALAYSIWLGKRRGYGTTRLAYRPHNVTHVVLGVVLLWFGWFGFNGGSALSANLRALQASMVTNVAAASGALTWMLWDWRLERKWSAVGLASGAVAGLVGITPASGYVGTPSALAIGVITATVCNWSTKLKFLLKYDDALDIFASHGIGGATGSFLTGIFADYRVAAFDGITAINGGWINHNYIQLGYQLAGITAIFAWSFVVTTILCVVVDHIPGCALRASEEAEIVGMDAADHGEFVYDFVYATREIDHHEPSGEIGQIEKSSSHQESEDVGEKHEKEVNHAARVTPAEV